MANPREMVKIWIPSRDVPHFFIYIDNPYQWTDDVLSVEGVTDVLITKGRKSQISVGVDPRYDTDEVSTEVLDLLLQDIPSAFKGQ